MRDETTNAAAGRCWYCGIPFTTLDDMQATAQSVGNELPSAIRWVCRESEACVERCQEACIERCQSNRLQMREDQ